MTHATCLAILVATLVLGDDLEGRFFIRNASHELIVELYRPRGRTVELADQPQRTGNRVQSRLDVRPRPAGVGH